MTRDKDRKRIIRRRMASTGESYTTARRQVLARAAKPRRPRSAPAPALRDAADPGAVAGISDARIKARTGRSWQDWVRLLNAEGAATMRHGEVARLVHDKHGVPDWWSQTVTVGYERLTGRRARGQRMDGHYELSKSKTLNVPVQAVFDAWVDDTQRRRWLRGVDATVRTSTRPKAMRLQWPDGTIVALWFTAKGDGKSMVALAHTRLSSAAALEQARAEWSVHLDRLQRLLGGDSR